MDVPDESEFVPSFVEQFRRGFVQEPLSAFSRNLKLENLRQAVWKDFDIEYVQRSAQRRLCSFVALDLS